MEGSHPFQIVGSYSARICGDQEKVAGFAMISWSSDCPVSRDKKALLKLIETLPDDVNVWYFRTIKQKSVIAPGWSGNCQIMLSSKSFTGSLKNPQQLAVNFGPQFVIDVTNKAK